MTDALDTHRKKKGKLEVRSKVAVNTAEDLSVAYTPGVADVSRAISEDTARVYEYTIKQNTVAVVSDGSAVLGLGNVGPEAALPVMEGKCALFKEFGGVDAFPLCLDTQDEDAIVRTVRNIAPVFGGILLEDIAAPKCFAVEERLQDMGIPVMHDDQHGTAIVLLAALINASGVAGKEMEDLRVVISGAGAAGTGVAKILTCLDYDKKICRSVRDIVVVDSTGAIYKGRSGLDSNKEELADITNRKKKKGGLETVIKGADAFIGVSAGGILTKEMISSMADNPIVFAMANPEPEIDPDEGREAAYVFGSGRSDHPNQINNVLAFPSVFRGALDAKATKITNGMKLAAAYAIADCVEPEKERIIPEPFRNCSDAIAKAVKEAATKDNVVRT